MREHIGRSPRARARWWVGQRRTLGRRLWEGADDDLVSAWNYGVSFLGDPHQGVVGVLSEPGSDQRLTLIPDRDRTVVKLALFSSGNAAIERERACLVELARSDWRTAGPRLQDPTAELPSRPVLLMERISGRHPRWFDPVLADLHHLLSDQRNTGARAGLFHGDVTPWNVIERSDGTLVLIDWEYADLDARADPLCGMMDFVLRGAAAARARAVRVRPILEIALSRVELRWGDRHAAARAYASYRSHVLRTAPSRGDALGTRAQVLLQTCFKKDTS
jgi:phosphotransferase family enzyme